MNPKFFFKFLRPRPAISGWLATAAIFAGALGPSATAPLEASKADARVRGEVESKAIEVATALGSVEMGEGVRCPRNALEVSWKKPGKGFTEGAYVEPVGPAPGDTTRAVNGVVICRNLSYAYMGFEAYLSNGRWIVNATPSLGEDHHEENDPDEIQLELPPPPAPAPLPEPSPQPKPKASSKPPNKAGLPIASGDGIDGYAQYDPQSTCDPSAKPGVSDFRSIVLARHSATRSAGITRNCSIGGRSEHKEGRAWDWWVNVNKASERAAAEDIINWLLASDSAGRKHAMARRMGVMYITWDRKIWASYRANDGWRAYNGAKPHTDHVHVSFSWAGSLRQTSYWTGVPISTGFSPPHPRSDRPKDFAKARRTAPNNPSGSEETIVKRIRRRVRPTPSPLDPTASPTPPPSRRVRRPMPSPTTSPTPQPTASPTTGLVVKPTPSPQPPTASPSPVRPQVAPATFPKVMPSPSPTAARQTVGSRTTRSRTPTRTVRQRYTPRRRRTTRTYPTPVGSPSPRPTPSASPTSGQTTAP